MGGPQELPGLLPLGWSLNKYGEDSRTLHWMGQRTAGEQAAFAFMRDSVRRMGSLSPGVICLLILYVVFTWLMSPEQQESLRVLEDEMFRAELKHREVICG